MTSGGFGARAEKIGVSCEQVGSLKIDSVTLTQADSSTDSSFPVSISSIAPVPRSCTTLFVGSTKLGNLHERLTESHRLILKGAPGIGKTETAIQYCKHYKNYYSDRVCWLRAEDPDPDITMLEFLARVSSSTVKSDKKDSLSRQIQSYWDYWKDDKFLLVIDNLRDYQNVSNLLPSQSDFFYCLFISNSTLRLPTFGNINISPLSESESIELLRHLVGSKKVIENEDIYAYFCKEVGYNPYCLHQLASVLTFQEAL